jgi:hypothetical protein
MKKTSNFTWAVAAILMTIGIAAALSAKDQPDRPRAADTATPEKPKAPSARDHQLQAAGAVALRLQKAAKDPEAFELRSAVVHPDGTACYEYRAKNSFGAVLPGAAVMRPDGKVLIQESHGNTFVGAWNKLCTRAGGDDIAPLLHHMDLIK